jgi:hypothetical protein
VLAAIAFIAVLVGVAFIVHAYFSDGWTEMPEARPPSDLRRRQLDDVAERDRVRR